MTTQFRGESNHTSSGRVVPGAAVSRLWLRDGSAVLLRALASDVRGERVAVVADDASTRSVGRAAYTRIYGPRAVLTLEVEEPFWRLGLPEALLAKLCMRAAADGISTLLARVHGLDARVLALLREFGAREACAGDAVDLEIATRVVRPAG